MNKKAKWQKKIILVHLREQVGKRIVCTYEDSRVQVSDLPNPPWNALKRFTHLLTYLLTYSVRLRGLKV